MFKNYVEGHAGTKVAADESDVKIKKLAQQNQQSLVAVLNADQLIQCEENITEEQISHIQKQKAAGITENLKIDSGLDDLVKVSFVKYDDLSLTRFSRPLILLNVGLVSFTWLIACVAAFAI